MFFFFILVCTTAIDQLVNWMHKEMELHGISLTILFILYLHTALVNVLEDLRDTIKDLMNNTLSIKDEIASLKDLIQNNPVVVEPPYSNIDPAARHPCGGTPGWRRVAYLNMSDTRYHCPLGWRPTGYPVRTCGRASHNGETCDPAIFQVTGGAYSKVCGRVVGYQYGGTAAFYAYHQNRSLSINNSYVTGISITHGNPRQHLWTYAAGRYESFYNWNFYYRQACPCDTNSYIYIPPFVGASWLCESGDNRNAFVSRGYSFFANDPLWDGEGCRSSSGCCRHEGPFYFVKQLAHATTDYIEVRICNYFSSQYSDVPIELLELYVK